MAGKKGRIDDELDGLFALPPEEFIAARDALAKRLKEEGQAEEAAKVRSLRRPTVSAWAANQVARQRPEDVMELLSAGAELHKAQRKVLSGVKGGGFREAMDRRRLAVAALVKAAEKILEEAGRGSAGTVDALLSTFEAASVDEVAGEALRAGRLTKELAAPSGFGGVTSLEVVAAPAEKPAVRREASAESRAEAREREKQAAEARRRAIKARADADRARERAERLAREADEAKRAAHDAARTAREAEAEARRAGSSPPRSV